MRRNTHDLESNKPWSAAMAAITLSGLVHAAPGREDIVIGQVAP